MKRPTQKSVNYFFGFVETNGDCMKCIYAEENANEIFTVTASQHCSLLSFILLVSRKKNERATDMQRNHAGLETKINYV